MKMDQQELVHMLQDPKLGFKMRPAWIVARAIVGLQRAGPHGSVSAVVPQVAPTEVHLAHISVEIVGEAGWPSIDLEVQDTISLKHTHGMTINDLKLALQREAGFPPTIQRLVNDAGKQLHCGTVDGFRTDRNVPWFKVSLIPRFRVTDQFPRGAVLPEVGDPRWNGFPVPQCCMTERSATHTELALACPHCETSGHVFLDPDSIVSERSHAVPDPADVLLAGVKRIVTATGESTRTPSATLELFSELRPRVERMAAFARRDSAAISTILLQYGFKVGTYVQTPLPGRQFAEGQGARWVEGHFSVWNIEMLDSLFGKLQQYHEAHDWLLDRGFSKENVKVIEATWSQSNTVEQAEIASTPAVDAETGALLQGQLGGIAFTVKDLERLDVDSLRLALRPGEEQTRQVAGAGAIAGTVATAGAGEAAGDGAHTEPSRHPSPAALAASPPTRSQEPKDTTALQGGASFNTALGKIDLGGAEFEAEAEPEGMAEEHPEAAEGSAQLLQKHNLPTQINWQHDHLSVEDDSDSAGLAARAPQQRRKRKAPERFVAGPASQHGDYPAEKRPTRGAHESNAVLRDRTPLDPSHRVLKHMKLFGPHRDFGRCVPTKAADRVPFCIYENIAELAKYDEGMAAVDICTNPVGAELALQVVQFNSGKAGLSDASRDRIYWTNIPLPTAQAAAQFPVRAEETICDTLVHQKFQPASIDRKILGCLTTKEDVDKLNALNKVLDEQNRRGGLRAPELSPEHKQTIKRSNLLFESPWRLRMLTVAERVSIMGFPNGWLGADVTTTEATKMLGNSWHVPTIELLLSGLQPEITRAVREDGLGTDKRPLVVLSLFDGIGAGYCALNNCLARWGLDDGLHMTYIAVENDEKCQQVMSRWFSSEERIGRVKSQSAASWMGNGHRRNHRLLSRDGQKRPGWSDIKEVEAQIVGQGKHKALLEDTFLVFNGFPCTNVSPNNRATKQTSNREGEAGEETGLLRQAERIIQRLMDWKKGRAVSLAQEENCPGAPEHAEKPKFVNTVLTHNLRKYTCKAGDTVSSVCQREGLIDPGVVKRVLDINRDRLEPINLNTSEVQVLKGFKMLIPDDSARLKTTVTEYNGWVQLKDNEESRSSIVDDTGRWYEGWTAKDQDGDIHWLVDEDIYQGLGFETRCEEYLKRRLDEGLDNSWYS